MAFSVGSEQQAEINVTPLIDVLLVLLIIFMVVVPVRPLGLESQVPQSSSTAAERALGPVDLRVMAVVGPQVRRQITYEVDGQPVAANELNGALLASIRLRPGRSVYVSGDAELSYADVARAIGVAKSAGAITIGVGRVAGGGK
jgi:biopolymer transport protein ExbD